MTKCTQNCIKKGDVYDEKLKVCKSKEVIVVPKKTLKKVKVLAKITNNIENPKKIDQTEKTQLPEKPKKTEKLDKLVTNSTCPEGTNKSPETKLCVKTVFISAENTSYSAFLTTQKATCATRNRVWDPVKKICTSLCTSSEFVYHNFHKKCELFIKDPIKMLKEIAAKCPEGTTFSLVYHTCVDSNWIEFGKKECRARGLRWWPKTATREKSGCYTLCIDTRKKFRDDTKSCNTKPLTKVMCK